MPLGAARCGGGVLPRSAWLRRAYSTAQDRYVSGREVASHSPVRSLCCCYASMVVRWLLRGRCRVRMLWWLHAYRQSGGGGRGAGVWPRGAWVAEVAPMRSASGRTTALQAAPARVPTRMHSRMRAEHRAAPPLAPGPALAGGARGHLGGCPSALPRGTSVDHWSMHEHRRQTGHTECHSAVAKAATGPSMTAAFRDVRAGMGELVQTVNGAPPRTGTAAER